MELRLCLLSDFLEIKMTIKPTNKRGQGDEQFGQRGVYIDKVTCLDVFGCKVSKMYFVKPAATRLLASGISASS
jgi:hypothetical protein